MRQMLLSFIFHICCTSSKSAGGHMAFHGQDPYINYSAWELGIPPIETQYLLCSRAVGIRKDSLSTSTIHMQTGLSAMNPVITMHNCPGIYMTPVNQTTTSVIILPARISYDLADTYLLYHIIYTSSCPCHVLLDLVVIQIEWIFCLEQCMTM